jgi:gamma-glutamylcyclotransferase (GGCT)/AIG2-like uncharacterized protein YtfP
LTEVNTLAESGRTCGYVFFYGTLLPEHAPAAMRRVVARLSFCGEGSVAGVLYDLGEYPGAVLDESSDRRVYGAVFRLPDDANILGEMDRYEGYDASFPDMSLFVRRRCPVELNDGNIIECWVYEYNGRPANARILESGRYDGDDRESKSRSLDG